MAVSRRAADEAAARQKISKAGCCRRKIREELFIS
jgi:hypothetical protein